MKSKMIWVNLGVSDIRRTAAFYAALGFQPNGANPITEDLTSFRFAENDLVIHFFRKEKLAESMCGEVTAPEHGNEVIFSLAAQSREEVAEWAKQAAAAGGTICREPAEDESGHYYCVFADPDGHKFNALWVHDGM